MTEKQARHTYFSEKIYFIGKVSISSLETECF